MQETSRNDTQGQLNIIWEALHGFRESCIPEGQDEEFDLQWSEITTAMAFITEDLEIDDIPFADSHLTLPDVAKICQSLSISDLKTLEYHLMDIRTDKEKAARQELKAQLAL